MSEPSRSLDIFYHLHLVSDSTGETLMNVTRATAAQFEHARPIEHFYALVRSERQLDRVMGSIENAPGVVFYTIVNRELRERLELKCAELKMPCVAVLDPILATLSRYLGAPVTWKAGAQHDLDDSYNDRMEALNFAMAHDDGQQLSTLNQADVVLVGVSRTSKTPTCIYLAHRGVRAANIPVIDGQDLPPEIFALTEPLVVGLTANPDRLVQIRRNRLLTLNEDRPTSYAEETPVRSEVLNAKRVFERQGWPVIDVTRRSVEETSAKIINLLKEKRGQVD